MKEYAVKPTLTELEARLQERLLLDRAVPGDRLMLADATLQMALDGSRPLTTAERQALQASPLTLRRFRHLAQTRATMRVQAPLTTSVQELRPHTASLASMLSGWSGSQGLLRAAATDTALTTLRTEDGYWTLDFVPGMAGWRVILALVADAPFATPAMQQALALRVQDGQGTLILQGRLDGDGECEAAWPFAEAPARHFQQTGATFTVLPEQE
jgi:hypothetical protein